MSRADETAGEFEAKTHLAALLDRAAKSEAKLSHKDIVEGMRALRKRVKPGNMSIREMIDEGRRF
jgi:hypothetical protein